MTNIEIVTLQPDQWQEYRDLRLMALKEEPQAYGSSYEDNVKHDICYEANKVLNEIEYTDKSRSIKTLVDKVIIKEGGWVNICGHIPLFAQKLGYEPASRNCGVAECGEEYPF